MNYCHNCRYFSELTGAYCDYCLAFFYANGRMPLKSDKPTPTDSLSVIYAQMGWIRP